MIISPSREQAAALLQLVTNDVPQELPTLADITLLLDSQGRLAIDDTHDAPSLLVLGDEYRDLIGSGTEDGADLGDRLHRSQKVDGIGVLHHHDEAVTCPDVLRVPRCQLLQLLVVPLGAHQAVHGCLTKGHPNLNARHGVHRSLEEVFGSLHEMALAQDDLGLLVLFYLHLGYLEIIHWYHSLSGSARDPQDLWR